jgi:allantoicase
MGTTARNSGRSRPPLAIGIVVTLLLSLTSVIAGVSPAGAVLPANFLKASGKYLRNNAGAGQIVTLRGTNLGGWLTLEDWMSPLGEFALDRTGWTASASVNGGSAGNVLDGDATTRWNTGAAQAGGEWFQVDMGTPTLFNRVYVDAAGFTGDYAAGYQVLVSADGTTWSNVASGTGAGQRIVATFTPVVDRYVRVVQTGTSASSWSVAEFNAFSDPVLNDGRFSATASVTGAGYSPANALDGNVNTRWTTGTPQQPGQSFTVNLGGVLNVNKVLLDAGPTSAGDFPISYQLWLSTDGTNFTEYADGNGNGRFTTILPWMGVYAQYVRIVQTGTSATNWWSIAGLSVYSSQSFDTTGWVATASSTEAGGSTGKALDGNSNTRWSTGAGQAPGQWFQVDFGATETFNQVQLDNTVDTNDYPRGYTLQVSADGTNWTQVASGAGYAKATPINFRAVKARYIKLTQTGTSTSWWSIDELSVSLFNDDNDMNLTYQNRFGAATTQSILDAHQNTWIQASDLDNIVAMGMNFVRLPIGWRTLLNDDGTWKTNAWTKIDWLVTQAAQRNLYVLLDLHTLPGGDCPWESCGRQGLNPNEFWNNTTYQDWVNNIWSTMAARYAGNATVAGYDLMNEPILSFNEGTAEVSQKSALYNRLYNTVRAVDPDHMVMMEAFFDWSKVAQPSTYGWTNVAYELHPYDMGNALDHDAQQNVVQTQLAGVAAKQADPNWGVPALYGEYELYKYDDVWNQWMGGLNALHVSWSNWSYKVIGGNDDGAGGYWGTYNSNLNPVPVINNDTSATVIAKLGKFATSAFQANTPLINDIKRFSGGADWMQSVALSQTGWTATASSTEPGGSPANALDWNTATRWSSGQPQASGQWFQVDMGSPRYFDQVSLETQSTGKFDYPRCYQMQVSSDATTWTTVRADQGFGWKEVLGFSPQYARYVRVSQTCSAASWWSIAEFHVYGPAPLTRTAWTATASSSGPGSTPAMAVDGNLGTRWTTGAAQSPGQWLQIDMGTTQTLNQLVLDAASSTGDYPRGYQIQTSPDGTTWSTAASGSGSGQAVLVQFPVQVARYLKINQTGSAGNWWSIAELNVYGEQENSRTGWTATASSTEPGGSTANAFDGNLATRWSSGAGQASGQWFQVDMGTPTWVNHVVMDAGPSTGDYARGFIVQVSNDAVAWQTVANGEGAGPWVNVNFPIVQDRYIRVTLQNSSGSWWSIAEFRTFQ